MASPFASSILITGGAGFLGRGILRYIQQQRIAASVTVYSRDEHKQYALRSKFPGVRTVLGDVRDTDRLTAIMAGHEIVIHAAAMKHVPEAERDVEEAIGVNIDGSRSVIKAAMRTGVRQVVGISTDKACSPRNAYGMTKAIMERAFQEANRLSHDTRFTCVRYGNVVSSTGSVVPLFLDQIARDGRVTLTSLDMTRFWLSINDAVALVEHAVSGKARGGHTFVPLCAAMRLTDVAEAVASIAIGGAPDRDKPSMRIIGTRPGEKLHEVLVDSFEAPYSIYDGEYIAIPPAHAMTGDTTHEVMPYESSHPDSWLTQDEFIRLVEDARTI